MLDKNQFTDGPCALDGNLICEHVSSKMFYGSQFLLRWLSTLSKLKKIQNVTVLLGYMTALLEYFHLNVSKLMRTYFHCLNILKQFLETTEIPMDLPML